VIVAVWSLGKEFRNSWRSPADYRQPFAQLLDDRNTTLKKRLSQFEPKAQVGLR
jgi:hypothetical protein